MSRLISMPVHDREIYLRLEVDDGKDAGIGREVLYLHDANQELAERTAADFGGLPVKKVTQVP